MSKVRQVLRWWGVRGNGDERGAVAVETALVSMLLVTMLYGVAEVSFLYRDSIVVSSASRAGARVASSLPRDDAFATGAATQVVGAIGAANASRIEAMWVFKANSAGLPDSGNFSTCTVCVKYKGTASGLVADGVSGWAASTQDACTGTQDSLGVYVRYRYPSRLGFFFPNQRVTESTIMRLEPLDKSGPCR